MWHILAALGSHLAGHARRWSYDWVHYEALAHSCHHSLYTADHRKEGKMSANDRTTAATRPALTRRDFLQRAGWGSVGATALILGAQHSRALA
ncbi:MAG: twin-arginine translocation signal domain-containing protein, partial [Candidatus Tectomicrobia bacterium]|nr:twin-arginine translocation signal domain-containing protein [Candidatus Tectomicrobia bacterium]